MNTKHTLTDSELSETGRLLRADGRGADLNAAEARHVEATLPARIAQVKRPRADLNVALPIGIVLAFSAIPLTDCGVIAWPTGVTGTIAGILAGLGVAAISVSIGWLVARARARKPLTVSEIAELAADLVIHHRIKNGAAV